MPELDQWCAMTAIYSLYIIYGKSDDTSEWSAAVNCAMTAYRIMILLAISARVRCVGETPMTDDWQPSALTGFPIVFGLSGINRKQDKY